MKLGATIGTCLRVLLEMRRRQLKSEQHGGDVGEAKNTMVLADALCCCRIMFCNSWPCLASVARSCGFYLIRGV